MEGAIAEREWIREENPFSLLLLQKFEQARSAASFFFLPLGAGVTPAEEV
jgi:hypothetical protein